MRKILTLGAGVVAAATLALAPASPANAVISPPGSVVSQVCTGLPGQLLAAVNSIVSATGAVSAAQTNFAARNAEFTTSQNNLVTALVGYITAIDLGGSVDAQQAILGARLSEYTDRAVLWGNAWNALDTANLNLVLANMTNSVLTGLSGGLTCVV